MNQAEQLISQPLGGPDAALLAQAVQLAHQNASAGELPFGALVVRAGEVLGTGVNTALRDGDPTAHAEVAAVRAACENLALLHLTGATIMSSCEPCAMCHTVAASVGVSKIVYAAPKEAIPDLGYPAPDGNAELMARMQQTLRAIAPEQIVYSATDHAAEPFLHYLETKEQP